MVYRDELAKNLSLDTIREARERIHSLIEGPVSSSGYRSVWHSLKMTGFHVPRYTMQTPLRDLDPEGTESKRKHRLRRRGYSNLAPNYAWRIERQVFESFEFINFSPKKKRIRKKQLNQGTFG